MLAEYILHPEKNSYKMDYLSLDYLKYSMVPIEDLIGTGLHQKSMAEVPLKYSVLFDKFYLINKILIIMIKIRSIKVT